MPKRVDHQQRRREIAEALLRVVGLHGLHGMSLREVAAEAGVSLRLVQYYFPSKEQLVLYTASYLTRRLAEQVAAHVSEAGIAPPPRVVIEATLVALLPTDPDTRRDAREELLVRQLQAVLTPPSDARAEAVGLLAMSAGLATSVLSGLRGVDEALIVLRHHLDRLLPAVPVSR
jgi:AcrR family transcriptional regulator